MKKVLPCASPNCAFEREDRARPTYRFSGHETFPFWVQAAGIIKDGKSTPCSEWEPRACVRSSLLPASSFLYHSRLCTKATLACKAQCHGCSALGTQTSSLANFGQVGQHSAANFTAQSTLIGLMKVQVRFGLVRGHATTRHSSMDGEQPSCLHPAAGTAQLKWISPGTGRAYTLARAPALNCRTELGI